ncbi:unnamed protein product [Brassica oleracea]
MLPKILTRASISSTTLTSRRGQGSFGLDVLLTLWI